MVAACTSRIVGPAILFACLTCAIPTDGTVSIVLPESQSGPASPVCGLLDQLPASIRTTASSWLSCHPSWPERPVGDVGGDANHKDGSVSALPVRLRKYDRDTVVRLQLESAADGESVQTAVDALELDVWQSTRTWVDIRLATEQIPILVSALDDRLASSLSIRIDNLANAIARSLAAPPIDRQSGRPTEPGPSNLFFSDYQPLGVIEPWMDLMANMFSSHVRLITIGKSYLGRDIRAFRIGVRPTIRTKQANRRRTIVLSAGTHAREWIGPMTVLYIANAFITGYGKTQPITELVQSFDWIFLPTTNPDGYAYSWESDRLWRKNRQPTPVEFCTGIDIDRAFSFHWDGVGAAEMTPCSESWPGSEPFEAVEAKALRDWARAEFESTDTEFTAFLDLHSYAQQVLYPYSFSCSEQPPSLENLQEVGIGLAKAIRLAPDSNPALYQVMSACEGNVDIRARQERDRTHRGSADKRDKRDKRERRVKREKRVKRVKKNKKDKKDKKNKKNKKDRAAPQVVPGGGSALDWFYTEMKARFSYQIKLRDTGAYGFLLPREEIEPTGREMIEAVQYLGRQLLGEIGLAAHDQDASEPELSDAEPELSDTEPARPLLVQAVLQ